MPEGPEARTMADKLRPVIVGKTIVAIHTTERAKITDQALIVCPTTITAVSSYGKKVLITLQCGVTMVTSLGMSGKFLYNRGAHSNIQFVLATPNGLKTATPQLTINGLKTLPGALAPPPALAETMNLFFDDTRYFGSIAIVDSGAGLQAVLHKLGPDLLQAALTPDTWLTTAEWQRIFSQRKCKVRSIAVLLADQSIIAGIGNYLRSEILYYAGIKPDRKVPELSAVELDRLRVVAHQVIYLSYSYGGYTIESFLSPDGSKGQYPAAVYIKEDHDKYGNPIMKMETTGGQVLRWVPALQK